MDLLRDQVTSRQIRGEPSSPEHSTSSGLLEFLATQESDESLDESAVELDGKRGVKCRHDCPAWLHPHLLSTIGKFRDGFEESSGLRHSGQRRSRCRRHRGHLHPCPPIATTRLGSPKRQFHSPSFTSISAAKCLHTAVIEGMPTKRLVSVFPSVNLAFTQTPNPALPTIDEAIVLPGLHVTTEAFVAGGEILRAVVKCQTIFRPAGRHSASDSPALLEDRYGNAMVSKRASTHRVPEIPAPITATRGSDSEMGLVAFFQ